MSTEIWEQLVHGKPLDQAGIRKIDGRLDLRNLRVPEPHAGNTIRMPGFEVTVLGNVSSIEGARWQSIDLSASLLSGLRFSDCQIQNCLFDRCEMTDLRVWRTDFSNVSFREADLREVMLGGTSENSSARNRFYDVDFRGADMRESMYGAAEFVRCRFDHAKLSNVDFESSTFVDCSFAGELHEVVFNRTGFRYERFPPNTMTRVDFRRAKLRMCEFRGWRH